MTLYTLISIKSYHKYVCYKNKRLKISKDNIFFRLSFMDGIPSPKYFLNTSIHGGKYQQALQRSAGNVNQLQEVY